MTFNLSSTFLSKLTVNPTQTMNIYVSRPNSARRLHVLITMVTVSSSWSVCNKGVSLTCHPHKPYMPLLPSCKASPPLGWYTNLYCLVTEAREKLAQSFYAACPAETRTRDLLIASPTLYRQCHDM